MCWSTHYLNKLEILYLFEIIKLLLNLKIYNVTRMKKLGLILSMIILLTNFSCSNAGKDNETKIKIETEYGIIKLKLYNETPLHRDNFIKLINDGVYTNLLFHRVIKNFMIQGGDPTSKNAKSGELVGTGDLGYTIPAEINPRFYHRRGVLAAARQGDDINPEKRSSASQFYIVQGRKFRSGELDTLQMKMEDARKSSMFQEKIKAAEQELNKLGADGKQDDLMARYNAIKEEIATEVAKLPSLGFTEEQRKAYTTIGGFPPLDGKYTVFGEVLEGMDVVDNIAQQETDRFDRPMKDIKFTITLIK